MAYETEYKCPGCSHAWIAYSIEPEDETCTDCGTVCSPVSSVDADEADVQTTDNQLYVVRLHRYVEQAAVIAVEATDPVAAVAAAKDRYDDLDWKDGDGIQDFNACAVYDDDGNTLWER